MNRKAFLAFFALPLLILASCSGKYDFVQKPLEDNTNRGLLTLGNNDAKLSINSLGEYYDKVVFTADEDWTVSGPSDWEKWINLKVKGNGSLGRAGTSEIEITVRPNFNVGQRSASLSFVGKESNKDLALLTIDQDAISFSIKGDDRMDFKWSEFQLMDGDKPAGNQRYAKTLTVTSNVAWSIEGQEKAEEFFVITAATEKGSNNGTITVVPKEPGLRDQDVLSLLRIIPDIEKTSIKREDLTDEELADIDELAMGMELSQDHLLFLARWDEESDPEFSELGGDLGSSPASFSVTTEDGTSWTLESLESSWLSITGNSGNLGPDPVEGPATLSVRPVWANPSAERRKFSIVISPNLPEEVLSGISQDVRERLKITLNGTQKGLVFQVTENGKELTSYGHDFENEDVGNETRQEYKVKVKTSAPFQKFCTVTDSYDWIGMEVSPDYFPIDSTYTLTFYLKKQNLDTKEAISTLSEAASYQNSGYAYFGSRAPAKGEQYLVRPNPGLFAPDDVSPDGALFIFSQKAFDFRIDGEWPEILRTGLPAMSGGARYPVKFVSSGPWEAIVNYDPESNENEANPDWVKEKNNRLEGQKGTFDLRFGSGSSNAYDHDRSAQVVFKSINHEAADEELQLVYDVKQRKFVFIVREGADAGSAEVENMQVAAYQPADEPVGFYLECGSNWEMTRWPSFLRPDKLKSSSEEDLNIRLTFGVVANTSTTPRPGEVIEIMAYLGDGQTTTRTVRVSQDAFVFDFTQSLNTLEPYYGSETRVGSIKLTKGAKWCVTRNGKDYSGDKVATGDTEDLLFTPEANLDAGNKSNVTYRLEVTEPSDVASRDLSFGQKGFEFDLSEEKAEFTELKTLSLSRTLRSSGPWYVVSEIPSWLHISSPSGDASSELTISVDPNTDKSPRSWKLDFESRAHKDADRTLRRSLSVSQRPFTWNVNVSGLSEEYDPVDNGPVYVNVTSSGPWEFRNLPDWIDVNLPSGEGNENGSALQVKLTVNDNLKASPRKGEFYLESTVPGANYYHRFTISQNMFIWEVGGGNYSWNTAIDTNPRSLTVKCSGPWEIRDENDKLVSNLNGWTFTPSSSTGSPKGVPVTVTPVPNDSRSARSAVFYVVSTKHGKSSNGIGSQRETLSMPGYVLHAGKEYAETYNCGEFSPWNPSDGHSFNLDSENTPQTFEIHVNTTPGAKWDIEVKPEDSSWIKVKEIAGNIATLQVANHTGDDPRDAHMTLKSTEPGITLTQYVLLTQKGFEFSANPEKLELQPTPSQQTVTITCSSEWEVESYDRSMVSSARRSGNQLVLDISESQEPRGSTVVLNSHGRQLQYQISQGRYVFEVSGLSSDITLSPRASDGVTNVSLTSNVEWWIDSCPDWLQTSIPVGSHRTPSNTNTGSPFNFNVRPQSDNLSGTTRTGVLVLKNNVESSGRSYKFTQDGFQFGSETVAEFDAFRADASADKRTVAFESSLPWTVSIPSQYSSWLHVSSPGGSGSGSLEFWVDNNNGGARSAYFEIKDTKYSLSRTVNIKQKAFVWTVSGSSHNFPPVNPQAWTFDVESSAPVTITPTDASWLSNVSPRSIPAGQKTTVTVTATQNIEQSARTASLLIEAPEAGKSSTVSLTQDPFKFNLTLDGQPVTNGTQVYYGPGGGNRIIAVDCSGGWHLEGVPGWLTAEKKPSEVIFVSDENTSGARHEDVITIVCEDNTSLNVTTKHIQDVFSVSPASLNMFGPLDMGTQSISISATGVWTVSGPAWVNLDPASGTESGTVEVSVKNNTGEQRSDDITVTYTPQGLDAPETRKVRVSQEKLEFSLTQESLTFGSKGAISQQISVTANIDWQVSTDHDDWLSVTRASGTVTVVPLSDNTATSPRSATVTVSSSLVPSISRTVSVTQEAPQAPEAVDLGLPSGLKWATMNVGASKPEEYGDYFAWGETEPKTDYSWTSYKWCNGSSNTLTKYNYDSGYGTVDNKTVLDPEDDAAHVNWGGSWRMPTAEECDELINNCTWTWTTENGVKGSKFTGPNGKSIFLPAAGRRYDTNLRDAGSCGDYWSSSLYTDDPGSAYYVYFYSVNVFWYGNFRFFGHSVRAVTE